MKIEMDLKYQARRILAFMVLVVLLMVFTSVVIKKGGDFTTYVIDSELQRQEAVLEEHFRTHGVER